MLEVTIDLNSKKVIEWRKILLDMQLFFENNKKTLLGVDSEVYKTSGYHTKLMINHLDDFIYELFTVLERLEKYEAGEMDIMFHRDDKGWIKYDEEIFRWLRIKREISALL